jgi:HSP20 family protein
MRFDPFRELDRVAERTLSGAARALYSMPMEAFRRGDQFMVLMDLPGVSRDDIDLTIERNVVSVRVRRAPVHQEGDEVIIDERPYGEFARQLFLGDNLDPDRMSADVSDGVLTLTIPVSEASKPRRVALGSAGSSGDAGSAGSSGDAGSAGAPSHAGPTAATGSGTASAAGPSSAV